MLVPLFFHMQLKRIRAVSNFILAHGRAAVRLERHCSAYFLFGRHPSPSSHPFAIIPSFSDSLNFDFDFSFGAPLPERFARHGPLPNPFAPGVPSGESRSTMGTPDPTPPPSPLPVPPDEDEAGPHRSRSPPQGRAAGSDEQAPGRNLHGWLPPQQARAVHVTIETLPDQGRLRLVWTHPVTGEVRRYISPIWGSEWLQLPLHTGVSGLMEIRGYRGPSLLRVLVDDDAHLDLPRSLRTVASFQLLQAQILQAAEVHARLGHLPDPGPGEPPLVAAVAINDEVLVAAELAQANQIQEPPMDDQEWGSPDSAGTTDSAGRAVVYQHRAVLGHPLHAGVGARPMAPHEFRTVNEQRGIPWLWSLAEVDDAYLRFDSSGDDGSTNVLFAAFLAMHSYGPHTHITQTLRDMRR